MCVYFNQINEFKFAIETIEARISTPIYRSLSMSQTEGAQYQLEIWL